MNGLFLWALSSRMQGRKRELVHGSVAGAALRVLEVALSIGSLTILARGLGPEGLGVYVLAMATVSLVGIPARAGLPALVAREVAVAAEEQQWGRLRGVLIFATVVVVSTSVGLVTIGMLAIWWLHLDGGGRAATLTLALVLLPIMALGDIGGAALRALRHPIQGQLPEFLIRPGLYALLLAGTATLTPGWLTPPRAMVLQLAAAGTAFAAGTVLLVRALPVEMSGVKPIFYARGWLASTLPLSMTAGLFVAQSSLGVLLLGTLASAEAAGVFRLAQRGADIVAFGISTIGMVAAPHLAGLHAAGAREQLQRLVLRASQAATAVAVLVMLGYAIAGGPILERLFGAGFLPGYTPLLVLGAAQTIRALFGMNPLLLNMARQEGIVTAAFAAGVVTQLGLCFALIPHYAAIGAALSVLASFLVWNLILWYAARRRLQIRTSALGL